MNFFDANILSFFNGISQHSVFFDSLVLFISNNHIVKTTVLVCLIWWLWFQKNENQENNRGKIVSVILSCFVAMLFTRLLVNALPYRPRPINNPDLHFIVPFGVKPEMFDTASSFPSDHAALFFALSYGLYLVSKKVGIFAILYTAIVIALPRIYLGLHNPTDILGGAFIGVLIMQIGCSKMINKRTAAPIMKWAEMHQGIFYTAFFLITYQMADMFNNSRAFASFFLKQLRQLL